jgi:hypothetical protein
MDVIGVSNLRVGSIRLKRLTQKFLRRKTWSLNSELYVLLIAAWLDLFGKNYGRYGPTSS